MPVVDGVPFLQGHFPGDPVMPGVAQLAMANDMADHKYGGAWPAGLRRVKFRAPVRPVAETGLETHVECQLFPTLTAGEVQFELKTSTLRTAGEQRPVAGDTLAAEGFLQLTHARAAATPPQATPAPAGPRPAQPEIEALLPHRRPALFLHEALHIAADDGTSWFTGSVPADNFLVRDKRVSVFAALEFAAQGAACLDALRAYPDTPARQLQGWLVGVKSATFHAPDFPLAVPLLASVSTSVRGGFVNVTTKVAAGETLVAAAELQIFVQ
jgi:predicted hotdog family 3-hydroxylacyl-ACP dehydratase